ncbi:MAG: DNA mismatch repair protein MutS [Candidatus Sumerlaeia bacterium]
MLIKAAQLTPMMRQYNALKAQYPDHLLLFRCGDFYETFGEDARRASQLLNITLTKRAHGRGGEIPLAGVPYHALDQYLARLIRQGQRVVIVEQVEDPKLAKGIVKREITRVVTPGTVIEENLLEGKRHNYLLAFVGLHDRWGLALVDVSTGAFGLTELTGVRPQDELLTELERLQPAELLVPKSLLDDITPLLDRSITLTPLGPEYFDPASARRALLEHFGVHNLEGFGCEDAPAAVAAAGALLQYLRETQMALLPHITRLRYVTLRNHLILDSITQRSLELVRNLHDGSRRGTLLEVLDHTLTAMGGRTLRQWILQPLAVREEIDARLDAVGEIYEQSPMRYELRAALKAVGDIERLLGRLACNRGSARDLAALRETLRQIPALRQTLQGASSSLLQTLAAQLDPLPELRTLLENAITDEPPLSVREGGLIRDGYSTELDELRSITRNVRSWLEQFRAREIARLGLNNLKISYNKVFGYYIEITRAALRGVTLPPDYERKQTLVNCERFITPELKEQEEKILNAEERINGLEFDLFTAIVKTVLEHTRPLQDAASALAALDALHSLAEAAIRGSYNRPTITADDRIVIEAGRHPVLEAVQLDPPFVPNDTRLDNRERQILIITGPNMAGKSTYIRQVALITLMAHIGSFVPARRAEIGIVDRIFTRVGAMDFLTRGQSTFLVEMNETANILNNATSRSLVILDEIGRGTSTYDGLSIAWSVIEYLHNRPGCNPKTLFATHYHEVTALEAQLPRVRNLNVAVLEEADRIVFLYRIVEGATDRSYGIYAARIAGVPPEVVARAQDILFRLECSRAAPDQIAAGSDGDHPATPADCADRAPEADDGRSRSESEPATAPTPPSSGAGLPFKPPARRELQLSLLDSPAHPVIRILRELDPDNLTPLQALALLHELKSKV